GIRDFHVTGVQTCALPISVEGGRQLSCQAGEAAAFQHQWLRIDLQVEAGELGGEDRVLQPIPDLGADHGRLQVTIDEVELQLIQIGRASCRERESKRES